MTKSVVHYGSAPDALTNTASGTSSQYKMFSYTSNHIHHVVLPKLGWDTQVFYSCGDPTVTSGTYARTHPQPHHRLAHAPRTAHSHPPTHHCV